MRKMSTGIFQLLSCCLIAACIAKELKGVPSIETLPTVPEMPTMLEYRATFTNREEGTTVSRIAYVNASSGESRTVKFNDHGKDEVVVSPEARALQMLTHTNGKKSCYAYTNQYFPHHLRVSFPHLPFVRTELLDEIPYNVFIQSGPKYKTVLKTSHNLVFDAKTGRKGRKFMLEYFHISKEGIIFEVDEFPAGTFALQSGNCVEDMQKQTSPPAEVQKAQNTEEHVLFSDFPESTWGGTQKGEMARSAQDLRRYRRSSKQLPLSIDNSRFAMPVRNQGMCGACWAFSSAAAMEIVYHKKHNMVVDGSVPFYGELWPLSPQYLVDCAGGNDHGHYFMYTKGCNGGYPAEGMKYVMKNGIPSEKDYSFRSVTGKQCKPVQNKTFPIAGVQQLVSWPNFTANAVEHVESIMDAVNQHGAVVVVMTVSSSFDYFSGRGIFSDPTCGPGLDHAVTVVGYGHDDQANMDYWLVRNSFGAEWGDNGYFRIKRGANICGIEDMAFIPIGH